MEMQVITDAEDRCIRQGRLVDVEESIIDGDQGEYQKVDLANELFHFGRVDGNMQIVGICEELQRHVAILRFGFRGELEFVRCWGKVKALDFIVCTDVLVVGLDGHVGDQWLSENYQAGLVVPEQARSSLPRGRTAPFN